MFILFFITINIFTKSNYFSYQNESLYNFQINVDFFDN
jgi:hypothetical protein